METASMYSPHTLTSRAVWRQRGAAHLKAESCCCYGHFQPFAQSWHSYIGKTFYMDHFWETWKSIWGNEACSMGKISADRTLASAAPAHHGNVIRHQTAWLPLQLGLLVAIFTIYLPAFPVTFLHFHFSSLHTWGSVAQFALPNPSPTPQGVLPGHSSPPSLREQHLRRSPRETASRFPQHCQNAWARPTDPSQCRAPHGAARAPLPEAGGHTTRWRPASSTTWDRKQRAHGGLSNTADYRSTHNTHME